MKVSRLVEILSACSSDAEVEIVCDNKVKKVKSVVTGDEVSLDKDSIIISSGDNTVYLTLIDKQLGGE